MIKLTDYEKQIMREASYEVYKAIKLLNNLDCNLGLIATPHSSLISSCADILNTIAEDMRANSGDQQ